MLKKTQLFVLLLALAKFALPFVLQDSVYELHRDELLYYQQGQHLALGYLENPPLLGWMAGISAWLGGSFFWVKFWPSLFGAFTLWLTAAICREFGGKTFAQILAALGILLAGFLRLHFLFQPNFLDVFFWSLSLYFLLRYINTTAHQYLYLLAVALALGWWSKYAVLFVIAAIVMGLLLTKNRKVFLNRHFWWSAALGVLIILPNVIWQYNHNWPLAHHMAELRTTQLQYVSRLTFLKEQILMLLPFLLVWLAGVLWLIASSRYVIFFFIYISILVLLLIGNGKGYYALGVYPMLLAAGGVAIETWTQQRAGLRYAVAALCIVSSLLLLPLWLPIQSPKKMAAFNNKYHLAEKGLLNWEDRKTHLLQQDFADMLGWKELTQKTESFFKSLPLQVRTKTVVFAGNYGQAGALKYYGGAAMADKVVCTNGSFLLWTCNALSFENILLVTDTPNESVTLLQHFKTSQIVDSVTNPYSRQQGNQIVFYAQADSTAKIMAAAMLQQLKQQFNR